jgi:chromate transport protein ChrA
MGVVAWQLGRVAVVDWITIALAQASAALLVHLRINSVWLVLGGAVVGLTAAFLRRCRSGCEPMNLRVPRSVVACRLAFGGIWCQFDSQQEFEISFW